MICRVMSTSTTLEPNFDFSTILLNFQTPQISVMRLSLRLLANPTAVGSISGLKPAPLALLPPIPLYRRLLRAHRKHLDSQQRLLGDEYIKTEFRSHRNVENPMHIVRLILCYCWQPREPHETLIIRIDWILD